MGKSLIVVHPRFDLVWPFAADHLHTLWKSGGDVEFHRLENENDQLLGQIANDTGNIIRLATLGVGVTKNCLQKFSVLKEATFQGSYGRNLSEDCLLYTSPSPRD